MSLSVPSPGRPPASASFGPDAGAPARPYIGGQAVLEGVMMRAPTSFAVVVRRGNGALVVRERAMAHVRRGISTWPFVRGVTSLVESLRLGSEALRFSAEQLELDLAAEGGAPQKSAARSAGSTGLNVFGAWGMSLFSLVTSDAPPTDSEGKAGRGAMGFMLAVAIVFLIALPQGAAALCNRALGLGLDIQSPAFQLMTGAFKLTIVVGYLMLIRRIPEIRRVFQYHGAEHKTISTYEAGEELTVGRAREKTTLHPRCGTTFLVMVALVSVVVFTLVGGLLPRIRTGHALADNVIFFLEKLPFLPVIAAVTFELQRLFARFCTRGPLRLLLWPGFVVQKITTIEPDDDQLEVALASLRATLFRERGKASEGDDVVFESYDEIARAPQLRPAA